MTGDARATLALLMLLALGAALLLSLSLPAGGDTAQCAVMADGAKRCWQMPAGR